MLPKTPQVEQIKLIPDTKQKALDMLEQEIMKKSEVVEDRRQLTKTEDEEFAIEFTNSDDNL